MSVQTQNTNLNPYSSGPIKNLEYIQNKALVIAPFEITKSGLLDTDLMLDTPGACTIYFYKANTSDLLEPGAEQFKSIRTIFDLGGLGLSPDSSNPRFLGSSKIQVIFKYDKNKSQRIIEKDPAYVANTTATLPDVLVSPDWDLSLPENDFFVICSIQPIVKSTNTTLSGASGMDMLFMIPSSECRELDLVTEFDILDTNNKVINLKKLPTGSGLVLDNDTRIEPVYSADFFGDGSNIATYLFDGSARDLSGNYPGTATNVTYADGKLGQAAVFNGTSSKVTNSSIPISDSMSISFWMNKTSFAGAYETYISMGINNSSTYKFLNIGRQNTTNTFRLDIGNGGGGVSTYIVPLSITNTISTDGLWHHYLVVWDKQIDKCIIYKDGVKEVLTTSIAGFNAAGGAGLNIGWGADTVQYYSSGSFDHVRIFNRALTSDEAKSLYKNSPVVVGIAQETEPVLSQKIDIIGDGSNTSTFLFANNSNDSKGLYTGTATNLTYDIGSTRLNSSIKFRSGSRFVINHTPWTQTNFAMSFWFKPTVNGTSQYLYSEDTDNWYMTGYDGNGYLCVRFGGGSNWTTTTTKLTSGTWYNFTLVKNGSTGLIYLNGDLVYSGGFVSQATLRIAFGSSANFIGNIGNIRIYSKALSTTEILTVYREYQWMINGTILPRADFFNDKSNIATYLFNGDCNDETGSYNGTGSGVSYVKGKFGQAVVAPGTTKNDYINLNIKPNFGTPTTVSFWEKGNSFVLRNDYYGGAYPTFYMVYTFFQMYKQNDNSGSLIILNINLDTSFASPNNFNHYCVVINYPLVKVYINNNLAGSGNMSQNVTGIPNYPLYFGNYYFNGGGTNPPSYTGQIDNVRIFNRSLSQREVLELFNEQPSIEEQYTLNEATNKTLSTVGNPLLRHDDAMGPAIKFDSTTGFHSVTVPGSSDLSFGTGDFTIETWARFSTIATDQYFCSLDTTGGITFGREGGKLIFAGRGPVTIDVSFTWTPTVGVWYHLAVTKESGTTRLWINGAVVATSTANLTYNISTGTFYVGAINASSYQFNGLLRNFHIMKGTAKYPIASGNFVSQYSYSKTSSTTFLLSVQKPVINTDGWGQAQIQTVEVIPTPSIVEQTGKVLTNSGVSIITDTYKNNGGSLYFNGVNYITAPISNEYDFGTGDFTVEAWVNFSSLTNYTTIVGTGRGNSTGWWIEFSNSRGITVLSNNILQFQSTTTIPSLNIWYHLAMARENGVLKVFLNGTIIGSSNTIAEFNCPYTLLVGAGLENNYKFNGYIDDLRIIKGQALYTTNFTPPTTSLVKDANTVFLLQAGDPNQPLTIKNPKRKDFFGDKSMVACYMLDSNVNDETGMYNGVATDITYTDGKFGKCANFNGSTSKISLNSINLIDTISFSCWFKYVDGGFFIFGLNTDASTNRQWSLAANSNGTINLTICKQDGTLVKLINTNEKLSLINWNHIYIDSNYIYINGVQTTNNLNGATIIETNNMRFSIILKSNDYLKFGSKSDSNSTNIGMKQGQLDNVKIFNRALTQDEVTALTNETTQDNATITLEVESEVQASEPDFFNDKSNVATYLFNGNANDENGKYNGTATNITYGAGKFGTGVNVSTANGAFKVDTGITLNTFSISMWFRRVNLTDIMAFVNFPTLTNKLYLYGSTNGSKIAIGKHAISETLSTTTITDLNWHHIVMNYDFTTSKATIYIDGVVTSINNTVIANMITTPSPITLFVSPTTGCFDNVRIFSRALNLTEVQELYKETKKVIYKPVTLPTSFNQKFLLDTGTSKEIKLLNYKTWTGTDNTRQGYKFYPQMIISDHVGHEDSFSPKYYLGTKLQRNLTEVLSQGIKTKRNVFNLKDMYLVDDLCIQTLEKINTQLATDQMIKFTDRLYQNGIKEKINAEVILDYISTPVTGTQNNDINSILKTSLITDYGFTQDEITNLNDNLNAFRSRARMNISAPVIQGTNGSLDQVKFTLPKTFVDGNRSQTEKKNLLVFGTDAGFNKFGLNGYSSPYSNISKRDATSTLVYSDLVNGLPSSNNPVSSKTYLCFSGSLTELTGKTYTSSGLSLSSTTKKYNDSSLYINNGLITIPASTLTIGTGDFTIEMQINPSSIAGIPILTLGSNQYQCCFMTFINPDGSLKFISGIGGWGWDFSSDRTTTIKNITANNWNHIVIQRRSGILEIYTNNILAYSGSWGYTIPTGSYIYVGSYVGGGTITAYYDDLRITNGIANYNGNATSAPLVGLSTPFKDILTNYKQQIPFTYIPLSTDAANTNNEPVFENLTDITGFNNSDIIIDLPNVL